MLIMTKKGLYCRAGDFYIDPKSGVDHAIVTHAHSDHARRGSRQYYCVNLGVSLLRARLGKKISVQAVPYRESFFLRDVKISFHPAGHILGSSQVRLEFAGQVWVVSGDYKRDPDPTCEPFEVVACDVFITEATFGTPAYTWNKDADVGQRIFDWWRENDSRGMNSVLFTYSLGKTQRILATLKQHAHKPIYCHPAAAELNSCYREHGVEMAATICMSSMAEDEVLSGELIIAPMAFLRSDQARVLGKKYRTAFASGWVNTRRGSYDQGFQLSDHADWNDLLQTVRETGARYVYVQHRSGSLVRKLKSWGLKAFPDTALFPKNPAQLTLL